MTATEPRGASASEAACDPTRLFDLSGRVALVTGASGALGGRFVETLAAAGARIALAGRRAAAMEARAATLPGGADAHLIVEMDVTDLASVEAGFDAAADRLGTVDLLVNNSGIADTGAELARDDAAWRALFDVNLDGARRAAVACARRLAAAERPGAIVNVASILGQRQGGAVTAYAASKAALIQLTKQHALEWARHGIRVNALAPGYVETDLNRAFFATEAGAALVRRIPQRRLGRVSDLDGALLLLASEAGAFMTGSVVTVDGGHMVSSL